MKKLLFFWLFFVCFCGAFSADYRTELRFFLQQSERLLREHTDLLRTSSAMYLDALRESGEVGKDEVEIMALLVDNYIDKKLCGHLSDVYLDCFKSYMSVEHMGFYLRLRGRADVLSADRHILEVVSGAAGDVSALMADALQSVVEGGRVPTVDALVCSDDYAALFERYWNGIRGDEVCYDEPLTDALEDMGGEGASEVFYENVKTLQRNLFISQVDEEELRAVLSLIESAPFAAYTEAVMCAKAAGALEEVMMNLAEDTGVDLLGD